MINNYTLYLDESGDHHIEKIRINNQGNRTKNQYLCLNGIIINNKNYQQIDNEWNKIRQIFTNKTGHVPYLHYRELARKEKSFSGLKDPRTEASFNEIYLNFLQQANITIISVVVDKKELFNQHSNPHHPHHPYHASLHVLLDRYCFFLHDKNANGNIIAESRQKQNDKPLKESYDSYLNSGGYNSYIQQNNLQKSLTKDIIFKQKKDMVAGLEISDMLATIMRSFILEEYNLNAMPNTFGKKVINIAKQKIRKSPKGDIKGWGIILFPE